MNKATVSKDRPMPERAYRYGVLYDLQPKESVTMEDFNYASLRSTITYIRERYGKTFTTQKQDDGTIIVWRLS